MLGVFGEIFYWVFNMSIAASIAGLVVLLIGRIRRLPRRIARALWIVPFLRMWLPVGLGSRYSLMSLLSRFTPLSAKAVVVYEGAESFTMMNSLLTADSYFPIVYKSDRMQSLFSIAALIWLVLAAALLLTFFILYFSTTGELRDAAHWKENVYLSDKIASPAVYGIFRPRILLPAALAEKDVTWILAHEKAHIRRGDNLWRMLAFITAAVYWFHPLSWLFLKRFLTETELACDECVLARCGESEKKAYAAALVDAAADGKAKSAFASAFGGAKIRVRIDRILSYKKLSLVSSGCFAALAVAAAAVLLTNVQ